jgi:hypothetical protein
MMTMTMRAAAVQQEEESAAEEGEGGDRRPEREDPLEVESL